MAHVIESRRGYNVVVRVGVIEIGEDEAKDEDQPNIFIPHKLQS